MTTLAQFDPHAIEYEQQPYEVFRRFQQMDPVHLGISQDPSAESWYFFAYADVAAGLKDARLIHERLRLMPPDAQAAAAQAAASVPFFRLAGSFLVSMDPPSHTRLRALISQAFTPHVVEQLRGFIEATANELLDRVVPAKRMDLIADYAGPLPLRVIGHMLGVPVEDYPKFREWSAALSATIEDSSPATLQKAMQASDELCIALRAVIEERRRTPQADLVSNLVAAEADGARLSEDELLATCMLLLVAGHETTANLIGNGTLALLRHPDQLEMLRTDSGLIPNAVEEMLRYDAPGRIAVRWAAEEIAIAGKTIKRGDRVALVVGAANHDPAVFEDPDKFDVKRNAARHLSFGMGIHYCLGAPLARLEGTIAFATLIDRLTSIEMVVSDEPRWQKRTSLHGLEHLHLTWK